MLDSTPEPSPPAQSRVRKRILQATKFLLPPIFAFAAALLHYETHVPRGPMVPRAKEDKKKTKPRSPKKEKRKPWQPREQAELDKLRVRWEKEAIGDEPDDPDFRRQHDTLLRAVAQVAREKALDRNPIALRVTPRCHTVRCSFEICGPGDSVDKIAEVLPKVVRHDGPLWHELREVEPEGEPAPTQAEGQEPVQEEPRSCRAWVVGFVVDGTKRKELKIEGEPDPEPVQPIEPVQPAEPAIERSPTVPSDSTKAPKRGPQPG